MALLQELRSDFDCELLQVAAGQYSEIANSIFLPSYDCYCYALRFLLKTANSCRVLWMSYLTSPMYWSETGSRLLPAVTGSLLPFFWNTRNRSWFSGGIGTIEWIIGIIITMATAKKSTKWHRRQVLLSWYSAITLIVRALCLYLPRSVLGCHSELSAVYVDVCVCFCGCTHSPNQ